MFFAGARMLPGAVFIVGEQMEAVKSSGLLNSCDEFVVGCNGGKESAPICRSIIPDKATIVFHGLESRSENLTIMEIEKWAPRHPNWAILYFHCKGATHIPNTNPEDFSAQWRRTMMKDLVLNWSNCVNDLCSGFDIVCSRWIWNMGVDRSQHIPAGNFLWINSSFAARLPSMLLRDRIKMSGLSAVESRYESEVYWGNGPRPRVKEYHEYGGDGIP
jgi:hypothetical protein